MKKRKLSTILLVVIFLVGLSLLLYPMVSNYWNSLHQSRAIADYLNTVSKIDTDEYQRLLQEARDYNDTLIGKTGRFTPTKEEAAAFRALLGSTGSAVGYIEIPAIQLELPIYLGTDESVLQVGVGILEGSSIPIGGDSIHAVLTGHRGLPSASLFTHLDRLVEGDLFHVSVLEEMVTYEVDQILIVEPQDMDALQIAEGEDVCTLVTCTPYGINSHRMLIRGHRVETPDDVLYPQVSADAMQIEPMLIAPLVAVPVLLLLLLFVLIGGGKRRSKPNQRKAKKGGNFGDDDQKMDR